MPLRAMKSVKTMSITITPNIKAITMITRIKKVDKLRLRILKTLTNRRFGNIILNENLKII